MERFVFEVYTPYITADDSMTGKNEENLFGLLTAQDIEHYLRAFLLKINMCNTLLLPNPKVCTFAVVMQLLRSREPTQTKSEHLWIPAEPVHTTTELQQFKLVPLRSMDTGVMKVQLFVEECRKN